MKLLVNAPKGTKDIVPSEVGKWKHVEETALKTAALYGFHEMRVPTFEHTELFLRGVGDTTDVVQKEMYTFNDKAGRSVTLRPEGTSGIMRASIEENLLSEKLPLKVSYDISCFRYEKPQAGRLREFHQVGVEEVGSALPEADAEVIALAGRIIRNLGIKGVTLYINSIGCKECRPKYQEKLKEYLKGRENELCPTCRERLVTNPLRIIDCKEEKCKEIVAGAPKMIDCLCPACREHFEKVKKYLEAMGIAYEIDPDIVRGLDYYTKTVFEFVTDVIGAQGTVCGGGRYDGLVKQIGGPDLSGVGFAMGIERLLLVMEASRAPLPEEEKCPLFIASMGDNAAAKAVYLTEKLRDAGINAEFDTCGRSLKAQMRYADKIGALYTMVLGDDELLKGQASLKNMSSRETVEIKIDDNLPEEFLKILKK